MRRHTEEPQQGKDSDSGGDRSVTGVGDMGVKGHYSRREVCVGEDDPNIRKRKDGAWGAGLGGLLWEDPRVSKA